MKTKFYIRKELNPKCQFVLTKTKLDDVSALAVAQARPRVSLEVWASICLPFVVGYIIAA